MKSSTLCAMAICVLAGCIESEPKKFEIQGFTGTISPSLTQYHKFPGVKYCFQVEFELENRSQIPISTVAGRLQSIKDGRSVEEFGKDFFSKVSGGIEPGEKRVVEAFLTFEHEGFSRLKERSKDDWQIVVSKINDAHEVNFKLKLKEIERK